MQRSAASQGTGGSSLCWSGWRVRGLSGVSELVSALDEAGIHTLLDMHQDVLSERFCGEGLPLWLAQQMGQGAPAFPKGGRFSSAWNMAEQHHCYSSPFGSRGYCSRCAHVGSPT